MKIALITNSFKTEIFAINLNSTFEFQFQSIKSLIRRSDASKAQYHCLNFKTSRTSKKHTLFIIFTSYNLRFYLCCFQSNIKNVALNSHKSLMQSRASNSLNSTFLSSISFCSTSTILLILSIKSSVRRKFSSQFSIQHIVIMIFTYQKRFVTFKK